jgi:hypothetical protein
MMRKMAGVGALMPPLQNNSDRFDDSKIENAILQNQNPVASRTLCNKLNGLADEISKITSKSQMNHYNSERD